MPTLDSRFDTTKSIATYHRLAGISLGIVTPPPYSYHAIRRLIEVDEDEETIHAASEDPLAEMLVEAADSLSHSERSGSHNIEIQPSSSLAALFDPESPMAKSYKPRLFMGINLRDDEPSICGLASVCEWQRDETLGTERFTQDVLRQQSLPRFDSNWLLIDVIASNKRGAGALLALQVYLLSCRSKQYKGVCALAVSKGGKKMFEALGFKTYNYRDGGMNTTLCYAAAHTLSLQDVHRRLSFPGNKTIIESMCFREGLTAASSGKVYGRC